MIDVWFAPLLFVSMLCFGFLVGYVLDARRSASKDIRIRHDDDMQTIDTVYGMISIERRYDGSDIHYSTCAEDSKSTSFKKSPGQTRGA